MRTISILVATIAAVALLGLAPVAIPAQSVVSLEGGRFSLADWTALQVGLRVATRTPQRTGVDGALAVLPGANGLALVTDVALSFPMGDDALFVTPRVGVSVIGAGGAAPGVHAGVGVVVAARKGVGLRVDYTHRRFYAGEGGLPGSSLTAGVAFLH